MGNILSYLWGGVIALLVVSFSFSLPVEQGNLTAQIGDYSSYQQNLNLNTGTNKLDYQRTGTTEGTLNIQTGTSQFNLQAGATATPALNITTGTNEVNLQGGLNPSLNIQTGTNIVQVQPGGLNVQNITTWDPATIDTVVSLQGGSETLIQTSADLQSYNNLVIQTRPSIETIEVENGTVIVSYDQPARFLGIFPAELDATVSVTNGNTVEVKLPWYSFLFTKRGLKAITSNVEVDLQNTSGGQSIQVRRDAQVINVITSAIDGVVNVSVNR